eukprot:scaffold57429_cov27-Tisochrysis_lutea.AAC.1
MRGDAAGTGDSRVVVAPPRQRPQRDIATAHSIRTHPDGAPPQRSIDLLKKESRHLRRCCMSQLPRR